MLSVYAEVEPRLKNTRFKLKAVIGVCPNAVAEAEVSRVSRTLRSAETELVCNSCLMLILNDCLPAHGSVRRTVVM